MGFVPGLELCRRFHDELVAPIMARRFPGLPYDAGRLDSGSELLGFDTERSMDHDWGPRLQLFLRPPDVPRLAGELGRGVRGRPARPVPRPARAVPPALPFRAMPSARQPRPFRAMPSARRPR